MKISETDLLKGIWALPSFPVVLVTVGRNIMTAAAFHFYSFEPPCVMVGIMPENYTYALIDNYKEFGINIPAADQVKIARACGSISGREGADKYKAAGVTPVESSIIKSYLIDECPLNLECEVVHKIDYPGTHQWYVGRIMAVHIEKEFEKEQALMFWSGEYRRVGEFVEHSW